MKIKTAKLDRVLPYVFIALVLGTLAYVIRAEIDAASGLREWPVKQEGCPCEIH